MTEAKKSFSYHWGSGIVAEEAQIETPHHMPTIQLLEFTEGPSAGEKTIRFCQYNLKGRFMRSPLLISADDLGEMRKALDQSPELKELLSLLVAP